MTFTTLWQLAYHLCGVTLLGKTEQEPLGALPMPIRSAVIQTAKRLCAEEITTTDVLDELIYAQGSYRRTRSWFLKDASIKAQLARTPGSSLSFASVEDYFEYYKLHTKERGQDVHFAERLFVEEAFLPVFGLAGLAQLEPQVGFKTRTGKNRYIDFVLYGKQNYAVEIEGAAYHDKARIEKAKFEDEKTRQQDLMVADYPYLPFTVAQIRDKKTVARLLELCEKDEQLHSLHLHGDFGSELKPTHMRLLALLQDFPEAFQKHQILAISLLHQAATTGKEVLRVAELGATLPLLGIALVDSLALVERVAALYGVRIALPALDITVIAPTQPELHTALLDAYLVQSKIDAPRGNVVINHKDIVPEDGVDFLATYRPTERERYADATPPEQFEVITKVFESGVKHTLPFTAKVADVSRDLID